MVDNCHSMFLHFADGLERLMLFTTVKVGVQIPGQDGDMKISTSITHTAIRKMNRQWPPLPNTARRKWRGCRVL